MPKKSYLKQRIKKATTLLKKEPQSAVAIIASAPPAIRSHDSHYRYRQNSDFLYFTESGTPDTAVVLSTEYPRPLLVTLKATAHKILWEGEQPSLRPLTRSLGAELVECDDLEKELWKRISGHQQLFFDPASSSVGARIAARAMQLTPAIRGRYPAHFSHLDRLMVKLRLYKDAHEVRKIRHAAKVTVESMQETLQLLRAGTSESDIARNLEFQFHRRGCETAFTTIAATGPSAATLHYENYRRTLRNGELLLLDCGAEFEGYSADITRVFPVNGTFSGVTAEIYSIVLEAQVAAIRKVKAGVRIKALYDATAQILVEGLKDLGLLRGTTSSLLKKGAHRQYFPHGLGHSLGLDVHDIGDHRNNTDPRLERGMVFTIEPGLYFPRKVRSIPACGVRIEDDVYVTEKGCEVLTKNCPKEIPEVERFIAEA